MASGKGTTQNFTVKCFTMPFGPLITVALICQMPVLDRNALLVHIHRVGMDNTTYTGFDEFREILHFTREWLLLVQTSMLIFIIHDCSSIMSHKMILKKLNNDIIHFAR